MPKRLKAALADAENNFQLSTESLKIKEAVVEQGPVFKRFKPRARGSASAIRKRTSHIRIVLVESERPKTKVTASKSVARGVTVKKSATTKKKVATKKALAKPATTSQSE